MYKEIDELLEAIRKEDIFIKYLKANKAMDDIKIKNLLSRHQSLQDDYLRLKKYNQYVSFQDVKNDLLKVKQEMNENNTIQQYYQKYHEFNDLLNQLTRVIFDGISEEIVMDQFTI